MRHWVLRLLARRAEAGAIGTTNKEQRCSWFEKVLKALPAGMRILDAGAGELANQRFCAHRDHVWQDFCQYDGQGDGAGLHTQRWNTNRIDIESDITAIPVPDESFGAGLRSEVLEHVPDPLAALAEFHRVLRRGGALILTAPFPSLTHFASDHFGNDFSRYFCRHHLPRLGFEIIELEANGNYFEFPGQELLRVPSVAQRYIGRTLSPSESSSLVLAPAVLDQLNRSGSRSEDLLCFG